eukprot:m.90690 g.90690  ORF g.90690 m.90690 type:complete len:315 (-) comp9874_c0_seq1:360-1304(-)
MVQLVNQVLVHGVLQHGWDKIRTPSLQEVWTPQRMRCNKVTLGIKLALDFRVQERCVIGFTHMDPGLRGVLPQRLSDTVECTAGTPAHKDVIESAGLSTRDTCHGLNDFGARGLGVHPRIGFVLKLPGVEPAMLLGQIGGFHQHACGFVRRIGENHLGTQESHEFPALDRERFGHDTDKRVSLGSAHHRQSNACVATRCFHHRLSRFDLAVSFSPFNDPQGQPVLDGSHRVEGFALDVDVHAFWSQPIQLDNRSRSDGCQNGVVCQGWQGVARQVDMLSLHSSIRSRSEQLSTSSSKSKHGRSVDEVMKKWPAG